MKKSSLNIFKRCPKSGRIVGYNVDTIVGKILFPLAGVLAIAWFLFRVIPKPDRIAYPCQKVAMSVGGTFITYVSALILSYPIFNKLKSVNKNMAYLIMLVFVAVGSTVVVKAITENPKNYVPILTNIDGPNNPMGVTRGIFPGRVAWVQDFDATLWDEVNGHWWEDANTDQNRTDKMFASAIGNITGEENVAKSWDKLFQFHNSLNGKGDQKYKQGEKIVIKVNLNAIHNSTDQWNDQGYPCPQMLNSLVKELIEVVGVKGEDIIIADPSRYLVGPLYDKIRSNVSDEYHKITFVEQTQLDIPNHVGAKPDTSNIIVFNMPDGTKYKMCLPQCYTDAEYLIDYAVVRPHRVFGITSAAKNHFGSVYDFEYKKFHPAKLHAFALWDYESPNKHKDPHSSPVLLGHKTIRNKTILYLADGLYTAYNQGGRVQRFSTMNNEWLSSLFMSLDPVALESVCFDFITSEPNLTLNNPCFNGNQDSQLHESAMANNPPSGTKYDPEGDGKGIESLGVHEHWNNNKDKQYSRNLGKNIGIELVSIQQ